MHKRLITVIGFAPLELVVLVALGAMLSAVSGTARAPSDVFAADAVAWATGYVTAPGGELLTVGQVCVQDSTLRTACTRIGPQPWLITGLTPGPAVIAIICSPLERDYRQAVENVLLPSGRYYDGIYRSTCHNPSTPRSSPASVPTPSALAKSGGFGP